MQLLRWVLMTPFSRKYFLAFQIFQSRPYGGSAFESCIVCWVSLESLRIVLVEHKVQVQNCDFLLFWVISGNAIKLWQYIIKMFTFLKSRKVRVVWWCNFSRSRSNFSRPPHKGSLQNAITYYIFATYYVLVTRWSTSFPPVPPLQFEINISLKYQKGALDNHEIWVSVAKYCIFGLFWAIL